MTSEKMKMYSLREPGWVSGGTGVTELRDQVVL